MRVGELGFWHRSTGGPPRPRPPLDESIRADVAIVGAGFTGLWTAYYLKRADPSLNVVILESEFAGYGASGRNGGWVMGFCEGSPKRYAKRGGRAGVFALQQELIGTVDEIGAVVEREHIEADFHKGGGLSVAVNPAQEGRLRSRVERARREWGLGEADLYLLDRRELETRIRVAGGRCASYTPHMARVNPGKLVNGLADLVESLGVSIHESTRVGEIRPHEAIAERGTVSAEWVVRATEGYTASLRGQGRELVALNSSMIVTEPLTEAAWEEIGWNGYETVGDNANVYIYSQRTADGRIAIGGRGVPYRFGSQPDFGAKTADVTVKSLKAKLDSLFPAATRAGVDHAWSGVLGVPRDWCVSVDADPATGLARAGGYTGQGVAAANLAARILRDLLLGRKTELTGLPWVGHRPPRWEVEPLRFAAIHSIHALYGQADRIEAHTGRPSLLARTVDSVSGRH
ncbi:MAG: FAD-dependent oxidoreductase [Solirubrobacterales bacterium]|nr:FAD-dependent oxidoreductase [Solirubrobacterales bacterium]